MTMVSEAENDGERTDRESQLIRSAIAVSYTHLCSSTALEQGPQQAWSKRRGRVPSSVLSTASICCAKFN